MFSFSIYILFIIWSLIQIAYGCYFHIALSKKRGQYAIKNNQLLPISIIICAHNESKNLAKNLPLVLSQVYTLSDGSPNFEVIVVNDRSTDNSASLLHDTVAEYGNILRVVETPTNVKPNFKGKKWALSFGVKAAQHNNLLFTDADCTPASKNWLSAMVAPLHNEIEIVAGYGAYTPQKSLLNTFIRWENLHAFMQMKAFAYLGFPYMASGRNLACTRDVYYKAENDERWHNSASGDDDLIVNIAGNEQNYTIVDSPESFTYTASKTTWKEWLKQKQRHMSDGKSYKRNIQWHLFLFGLTYNAFWFYLIALVFTPYIRFTIAAILIRSIILWWAWKKTDKIVKEDIPLYLLPFFDFGWMIYNFALLPYIFKKNKQHWT